MIEMSNSPLVSYTKISPNRTKNRNHKIDTITIHCYVGQVSVESMAEWLCSPKAQASSNYGIGKDGRIAMFVEEKDRSWCSSSSSNDNRAITIECASDKKAPYRINDEVYKSLINLCVDICKRNGINELKWKGDKSLIGNIDQQNMTVHKWFKNKDCPGQYIYDRLGKIASEVNARLNGSVQIPVKPIKIEPPFQIDVIISDLNYRSKPSMDGVVIGQTGKGIFTITEVKDGWGKLKSGIGWVYLENESYCKIIEKSSKPQTDENFQVRIDIDDLNIRTGPGVSYPKIGVTGKGVFTITEVKDGWGKLKSGIEWISLSYTKRI